MEFEKKLYNFITDILEKRINRATVYISFGFQDEKIRHKTLLEV